MLIHLLSELYMLTDKSHQFEATSDFVDRRISDFREFEKYSKYLSGFLGSGLSMKNSLIDMLKEPVVNQETERIQREYFEKMKKSEAQFKEENKTLNTKE